MSGAVVGSLHQLAQDLERIGVAWALIGGFAVSARAEPRFTRDVDVCVLVDDDQGAEATVLALRQRGYDIGSVVEHGYLERLATARMVSPIGGGAIVDLLFASSGLEPEIVGSAEHLEILPGLIAPVARVPHLVVLKLLAREDDRPQDQIDLDALRDILTHADAADVMSLASVVVERGYHRERDLVALAEAYLAEGPLSGS
ncbi:nucleotidyl transferase AbiEii/AbiGii toxin family protein [Ornithinimicrobium sp. Y1847]|uniref:nucleotidyl transferase AbiEii/AbiGii toxin family protein n=1 Tax=unclassified Ornithinimicrobium TaxID=2615080 RepID=UPI003B68434C